MPRISDENFAAILNSADSIEVVNGEHDQNVDGWLLKPCEALTFRGKQITEKLVQDLFSLQGLGLICMTVKVGDVALEFPLIAGEFQLNEATERFESWHQSVKV